ncbi:MAG: hypothetical protein ACJAZN_003365 [Planctomycetota bacterium]|jgi:hypothetical protein
MRWQAEGMKMIHRHGSTSFLATSLLLVGACRSTAPEAPPAPWTCSPRVELSSVWQHLSERHDKDHDGRILASEYGRGEVRFANYDRNEDGVLEAADFPDDTYFNGFSHMLLKDADADEDEQVSPAEWQSFCSEFDVNGDGRIVRSEVEESMGDWTDDWNLFLLSFDQDSDGDFDDHDLQLTFRDQDYNGDGLLTGKELSGWQPTAERPDGEAPGVGTPAPEFTLSYAGDPSRTFSLSAQTMSAADARPIALIFGSYT